MSDSNTPPVLPKWLSRSVVILLALQVGLLWTHGSLLQRQHDDIQSLREDVQALADSLDQDQDDGDSNEADSGPQPHAARWIRRKHKARVVRATYAAQDEGDPALKDLNNDQERVRQSERDAIAKARDAQEKLSIQANIQKADAKAQREAQAQPWKPWLWVGGAAAAAILLGRSLYRRRG
jgi:ElaB/YqjD/DUF883 family membrane-anchored ribosome-binding protein